MAQTPTITMSASKYDMPLPPHSIERTKDKYSGKPISDFDTAYDLIADRQENTPRRGESAPEFELMTADGDQMVRLSALRKNKPVVLIISSWGCDIFRESLGGLNELHTRFGEQANFVMVYIREAHSKDGWIPAMARVSDPKTFAERSEVARRCAKQLRIKHMVLVDTIEDSVATQWGAWPTRLFVIETDGRVIYAGAQGPWGYQPYRGFTHGSGEKNGWDKPFNNESLEEFLEQRFPTIHAPVPVLKQKP